MGTALSRTRCVKTCDHTCNCSAAFSGADLRSGRGHQALVEIKLTLRFSEVKSLIFKLLSTTYPPRVPTLSTAWEQKYPQKTPYIVASHIESHYIVRFYESATVIYLVVKPQYKQALQVL